MKEKDVFVNLSNAIIIQAVDDYRKCLKKLKKKPYHQDALKQKREIESFFHSSWYGCLTDLDPDIILKSLNDEVTA